MSQKRVQQATDRLARLAAQQHGVVALHQLYSLGFSDSQVRTRVAGGWLHPLHRAVFAVGRRALSMEGHWLAAVLGCGKDAVLSHQSAGELWGIRRRRHGSVHVSVPRGGGRRPRPGIVLHRVAVLDSEERTLHCRIPVTTPARTILDLATQLPHRELERAADEAERLGLCSENDLGEVVGSHFGRPGARVLRALLKQHRAGSTATRNYFEERFLQLWRRHHLPRPEVNVPLLDYVVDFFWRDARLIVEVDGRATHGTRRAFQTDRDRDGRLAVAGYRVLRFTWWDLTRRPAVVADRVRRMLEAAA
jgi:very-short-patch-repair endonuclease